jgi:hypothetical protein
MFSMIFRDVPPLLGLHLHRRQLVFVYLCHWRITVVRCASLEIASQWSTVNRKMIMGQTKYRFARGIEIARKHAVDGVRYMKPRDLPRTIERMAHIVKLRHFAVGRAQERASSAVEVA